MSFRITATGHNARLPQNISELLSGERGPAADAHAIQPYYTRLLAQACGLTVTLKHGGRSHHRYRFVNARVALRG